MTVTVVLLVVVVTTVLVVVWICAGRVLVVVEAGKIFVVVSVLVEVTVGTGQSSALHAAEMMGPMMSFTSLLSRGALWTNRRKQLQ